MASLSASLWRRAAIVWMVFVVLTVYSYPYLATTRTLKSRQVPFSFAADLSLYLNLGQLSSAGNQPVLNPYYGTPMHVGVFGYLTFDLAFRIFGWIEHLLNYNLWCAVLIWNWLWWIAIYAGAFWFFRLVLPEEASPVLWLGMSLLFFFNFGVLKALLFAWLHFPSWAGFEALSLPYIRTFFPPIPVGLLLLYLSLQIRALRVSTWYEWAGMCGLQACAFAMFPYATLMMAGSTFIVTLACIRSLLPISLLKRIVPYGVACAVIDCAFLLRRLAPGGEHDSQFSLFSFRPSHIVDLTGGALILLILLTIATTVIAPIRSREAKWTLVGLGLSNIFLMLADAVFAPSLLLSPHGAYFLHCTIALQVTYLIAAAFASQKRAPRWTRPACIAATVFVTIIFVTINGAMLAIGNYRSSLPENREAADLARALTSFKIDNGDLIIARADTVDDLCAWVPLLHRGTVLFCRSAQYELADSERRGFHRLRQALYLYFTGKDSRWVDGVVNDPAALTAQDRLAFAGEISVSDKETLDRGKREIMTELLPKLASVEQRQDQAKLFFQPYPSILVVDDASHPLFVKDRLLSYLSIESEERSGNFVLLRCRPSAQRDAVGPSSSRAASSRKNAFLARPGGS